MLLFILDSGPYVYKFRILIRIILMAEKQQCMLWSGPVWVYIVCLIMAITIDNMTDIVNWMPCMYADSKGQAQPMHPCSLVSLHY